MDHRMGREEREEGRRRGREYEHTYLIFDCYPSLLIGRDKSSDRIRTGRMELRSHTSRGSAVLPLQQCFLFLSIKRDKKGRN